MMVKKADLLLVGQTPPPHHGQSVVTAMLFEHNWGDLDVIRLRMSYSDSIDDVGKASIGKIWHLGSLILKTWKILITKRPKILYYLPASANRTPVIRDIVYLALVRVFFPKTVFHYHAGGLPDFVKRAGILGLLARAVYARANVSIDVIETSPPTGSYFESRDNVSVRNGVDVDLVYRKRIEEKTFRVLFVGVLNEGKGLIDIIETAHRLKQQGGDYEFYIVGSWVSASFKKEVEDLVGNYDLGDWIYFTGPLQGSEKWQAYADADCFFFPSHYEAETFGLVLVEAMAFGLPLVTTNWRGIPHVVEGGECAYLCDVHSPDQYAEVLGRLKSDTPLRLIMGEAAKKHYQENYTRECFIMGMKKVFRTALED